MDLDADHLVLLVFDIDKSLFLEVSLSQVLNNWILRLLTAALITACPATKLDEISLSAATHKNFAKIFDKLVFLLNNIFLFNRVALD